MKNNFFIIVAFLILTSSGTVFAQNTHCPVMPGESVSKKFYADYKGHRIFFCCRNCQRSFRKHPEKYLKNLNQGLKGEQS